MIAAADRSRELEIMDVPVYGNSTITRGDATTYNEDGTSLLVIDTTLVSHSDTNSTGSGTLSISGISNENTIFANHTLESNNQFSNSNGTSNSDTTGSSHVEVTTDAEGNAQYSGGGSSTTEADGFVRWFGTGILIVGGALGYTRFHIVTTTDAYDATSTTTVTFAADGTPTETTDTNNNVTGSVIGLKTFIGVFTSRIFVVNRGYDQVVEYIGFARNAYSPSGTPSVEGGQESTGVSLAISNGSESSLASTGIDESGGESGTTDQSSGDDFDINEWINENSLRNSLFGAVSVIAGGIEIVAGILLLPETFGASSIIIAHGLDTAVTGLFSVVTGESSRTLTQVIATNAFRWAGFDETSSSIGGLLVDIGLGLVGGLAAVKSAPKLAALFGPKTAGSGNRLVVGGGRANGFPALNEGDIALNISVASQADIIADIRFVSPSNIGRFRTVFFERVPFDVIDNAAASNAAQLLQPGGRLHILTGRAANRNVIRAALERAGFVDIQINENFDRALEIIARLGGG